MRFWACAVDTVGLCDVIINVIDIVIVRLCQLVCVTEMRLVFCALALGLVFLPAMAKHGYSDSWAVEVSGGEAKARELAAKHGFIFRGQVSGTAFIALTDGSLRSNITCERNRYYVLSTGR